MRCDGGDDGACSFDAALQALDYFFVGAFTLEMVLKILAHGLIVPHPTAYLRDPWNVLDGVIVVVALVSLSPQGEGDLSALKTLRALRALRPLRMISRAPGMKLVVP